MDPNQVVSRPGVIETAWITPDGSYITTNEAEATANGATHQVSAQLAVLADGRKQYIVYTGSARDLSAGTYSLAGAPLPTPDATQAAKWKEQQAAGQRQETAGQRQIDQTERAVKEKKPVRDPASPTGWTEEITYEDGRVTRNVGIKSPEDKPVTPATVATNTTEPFIVTRQPDGSLTQEDNPNYRGADPKPGATHFSVAGDGRTYAIPIDAQGRPGQAVDVGLPPKPTEAQSPYSQVQQDPDTKKWYGMRRDGKGWEELPPGGPGSASAAPAGSSPLLPQITKDSQAAIRKYQAELQAEVNSGRRTDAWAQARFNEAKDLAALTIQEVTLTQREGESRRNADVNLMTNRQNAATTGFGQALDAVNAGNKYLPKGSTLGGEAFSALLGLQRGHAERMGAYTDPYGSQTGAPPPGAPVAARPVTGAPGPSGPPPGTDAATPAQAAGNLMLTVKNKATGAVATVLASVFQTRPDRDQFEVIDAQNVVTPAATTPPSPGAPPAVDPATMPPGAVAPDPSSGLMMRAGLSDSGEPPPPNGAQLPVYRDRDGPSTYTIPWGGGGFDTVTTPPVDGVPNRYPQIPPDLMPLDPRENRPDNTRRQLEDPNSSHSVYKTSRAAPQQEFAVLASAMGQQPGEPPQWPGSPSLEYPVYAPELPDAPPLHYGPDGSLQESGGPDQTPARNWREMSPYPPRPYRPPPGEINPSLPEFRDGTVARAPMALPSLSMQAPAEPEPFAMMAARIRSTPPWRLTESDLNQFVAAGGDPADFWSDGITGVFR